MANAHMAKNAIALARNGRQPFALSKTPHRNDELGSLSKGRANGGALSRAYTTAARSPA